MLACASVTSSLLLGPSIQARGLPSAPANAEFQQCSWDHPGTDVFTGDVVGAVDRYTDIPPEVRARLKQRMAERRYDDMVSIKRDSIVGKQSYQPEIREMHFGAGSVCGTISRARWTPQMQERGLVYCDSGECILVPTVCRNVSRISAAPLAALHAGGGGLGAAAAGAPSPREGGPLLFEPPSAGAPRAGNPPSLAPNGASLLDGQVAALQAGPAGWLANVPNGSAPTGAAGNEAAPAGTSSINTPGASAAQSGAPGSALADEPLWAIHLPYIIQAPPNPGPVFVLPSSPVPEPATWPLWAVGGGLTLWVGRRRGGRVTVAQRKPSATAFSNT